MWVDGAFAWEDTSVNWNGRGLSWFYTSINQKDPNNGGCAYVWIDDVAVS